MMKSSWIVHVTPDPGGPEGSYSISLSLRGDGNQEATAIEPCPTLEAFRERARELGAMLEQAGHEAEKRVAELSINAGEGKPPEEAWAEMSRLSSEEEMADYFNSLSETERHGLADYILTNVSMFSGKGPVFAQRYNADSHLME